MTNPWVSWDEAFLWYLRCTDFTSPGHSWVSGWLCGEWDYIFPMLNATQEMHTWNMTWPHKGHLVFRASFSRDKSLAQQTRTESLLHFRYGPGHQGCRWTGVHGLMQETRVTRHACSTVIYLSFKARKKSHEKRVVWQPDLDSQNQPHEGWDSESWQTSRCCPSKGVGKVITGRASQIKWENIMRWRTNREFGKYRMEMMIVERAGQVTRRWIDHEGQDKNLKFELEI